MNNRASEEPADDARAAARVLAGLNLVPATLDAAAPSEVTNALAGMASGDIVIYRKPDQTRFDVRPSAQFTHVRSISIVDATGRVWASSDSALRGTSLAGDAQRATVLGAASSGSTNLQRDSKLGSFDGGIAGIGAYPLERPAGAVVFVEKAAIASPTGAALWRAELRASAATFGITAFILFIPGLAVATLFAVRSARTIADPLESLNAAAGALAAGDLTRRVRTTGEDEVATLANSFDAMADRLSEAMDDLAAQRARAEALLDQNRQLVANVSHELRTPVAIIRGHLEALAEETGDGTRLPLLLAESSRLEQLIDDLFRAASDDAAPLPLEIASIDAAATLREAVAPLVDVGRREAGVTVVIEAPNEPLPCLGDAARLVRVLQNLVRNALRHTPDGGSSWRGLSRATMPWNSASATAAKASPKTICRTSSIASTEATPKLRERAGAGLGLAIAHQFVEAMGGTLSGEKRPRGGVHDPAATARWQ